MDWRHLTFRCSSVGYLMTEPKAKKEKEAGNLSESAKTHCIDVWVSNRYGRNDDVSSKFIEKGLMVEEDAITLFSRMNKKFFKKNQQKVENGYIKGTPDLYRGIDILAAEHIIDVKSSWDIYTFSRVRGKSINDMYWWQLQAYMALTGATKATLAYCLIDTPEVIINDEKRRLLWKMGVISEEDRTYQQACEELDKNMRFGDIPMQERIIQFEIDRDDEAILAMYEKVKKAREFIASIDAGVSIHSQLKAEGQDA